MTEPDETMTRIGEGIALNQQGDRDQARQLFEELWERIGADGNSMHRCALAHSMADVQDDPADELVWDLRALQAADAATDAQAEQAGMQGVAGCTRRCTSTSATSTCAWATGQPPARTSTPARPSSARSARTATAP